MSSNILLYQYLKVNHQYDKSSEFVALTRGYVKELENMGNDLCGSVIFNTSYG